MQDHGQPVYVGRLNDKPLRFFPPQTDDDMMPWVAWEDLMNALPMNYTLRRKILQTSKRMLSKFPDLVKRIATGDGTVLMAGYQAVQGLMSAFKDLKLADDAVHFAFVQQVVTAAERHNPLLFDRIDGEKVISSQVVAALLGEKHEGIVKQIEKLPLGEVKQAPSQTEH